MSISVICLTYNHESFVEKAIKGFALQNMSSEIEFLIFDDASNDLTFDKISNSIKLLDLKNTVCLRNEFNLGVNKNFVNALKSTKYKYIAICEGDDFWIDSDKLNKQFRFLESNPNFSFCCTNISVVNDVDEIIPNAWPNKQKSFVISKRVLGNALPIPTCSLLFRSNGIVTDDHFLERLAKAPWPDFFLTSWLLTFGKGYFFEEKTAVYRQHQQGYFTGAPPKIRLKKSRETRWIFFWFCIKRFRLFSAVICFKNIVRFPNF